MRFKTGLLFLLLNTILFVDSIAQKIPLVYSAENTGTNCPVTGCSFAGKIALYSGAFDERTALTIAQ